MRETGSAARTASVRSPPFPCVINALTHTQECAKRTHGAKSFRPHSFCGKNARKALYTNGWKAFCHLVRMRPAVRIRPAAPKSIENFGFRCFFAASAKTRSMVSFLMAQSSLSFPLSSIALVAAIKTTDLLRTLAHLPGGWYNRGRE